MTTQVLSLIIIIVTCIISYQGFKSSSVIAKYEFNVEKILLYKQYYRLISSGFVHLGWLHLILNMYVLLVFGATLTPIMFIITYFAGLAGSDLFALLIHRHHSDYSSIGSSGAINAIIFASIALYPGSDINLFFIAIPGWIFALIFVAYSIYGIRSRSNNVGHEAHLGGAFIGVLIAIAFDPSIVVTNWLPIVITILPVSILIYLIITKPQFLLVDNFFFNHHQNYNIDQRYNIGKKKKEMELDEILEKIHRKGKKSLTKNELAKLEELSRQL